MASSRCFLCGNKIRRQLGFNPVSLNRDNKEILTALRKSWTKSLCTLLDVTTMEKNRVSLDAMPYCLSCHEIICDIEFMMSTINRLEGKLHIVKEEIKVLLGQSYRKSDRKHRQLIQEILSPAEYVHVKDSPEQLNSLVEPQSPKYETSFQDHFTENDDVSLEHGAGGEGDCEYRSEPDPAWLPDEDIKHHQPSNKIEAKRPRLYPTVRVQKVQHKGSNQRDGVTLTPKPKRVKRGCNTGYTCPVCQEVINGGRNAIRRHQKSHDSDFKSISTCQLCGKRYNTSQEVKDHEILHKPGPGVSNPFFCVLCPAQLTSTYDLQEHVLAKHETENVFKCDMCPAIRTSAEKLRCHKKRSHLIGVKKMLQCPHCPLQAIFPSVLKYHIKTHGEKNFKCDIGDCATAYHNNNNLLKHKRKAHGIDAKAFPCTLCNRIFQSNGGLRDHQLYHSTLRPFMCEICPATFKSVRNLNTHRKVHSKVSGTNVKLQKPRKARLSDMRLQNETEKLNFDQHPAEFGAIEQNQVENYGIPDEVLQNALIN